MSRPLFPQPESQRSRRQAEDISPFPLDYGIEATINGGTFIGIGATQMSANFSDSSTQGALLVSTGNQKSGTLVELTDDTGQLLLSQTADQDFSGILLSCPSLQQGK